MALRKEWSAILGRNEPLIRYCDFYNHSQNVVGCSLGVGCLLENPLFVNLGAADFRLMRESSCIDAGNPLSPPDPDLTGRIWAALFRSNNFCPSAAAHTVNFALFDAFPNPFNAQVELVITLPQAQLGKSLFTIRRAGWFTIFLWGSCWRRKPLCWDPRISVRASIGPS